jgi:hypothetical protein
MMGETELISSESRAWFMHHLDAKLLEMGYVRLRGTLTVYPVTGVHHACPADVDRIIGAARRVMKPDPLEELKGEFYV